VPYFTFADIIVNSDGHTPDLWTMSICIFTPLLFVVTFKCMNYIRTYNWLQLAAIYPLSIMSYFLYLWVTDTFVDMVMQHHTFFVIFTSPTLLLTMGLSIAVCSMTDYTLRAINNFLLTDTCDIVVR